MGSTLHKEGAESGAASNKAIVEDIKSFIVTADKEQSREELLDQFSDLLAVHQLDNNLSTKYLKSQRLPKLARTVCGLLLIIAGFGAISMPSVLFHTGSDTLIVKDVLGAIAAGTGVWMLWKLEIKQ